VKDAGPGARLWARRLVVAYPATWRARYGEEFIELLAADLEDRPRGLGPVINVVGNGLLARLRTAGVLGPAAPALDPVDGARTSLATAGAMVAVFSMFGTAMWAQVTVGWRWEPPPTPAVALAMVAMSVAALGLVVLAAAAFLPVGWALFGAIVRRRLTGLTRPGLLVLGGSTVLVGGSATFQSRWPGTGGHHWAYHGLVPPGVAAFGWAATRSVSAYWWHPEALGKLEAAEIVWMAVSPVAMLLVVVGMIKIVRRLDLSRTVLAYEADLGVGAVVAMATFMGGAGAWVMADAAPGPTGIYRVGAIDVVGLVVLGVALSAAVQAVVHTRIAALLWRGADRAAIARPGR
jgi:hypothetical protein